MNLADTIRNYYFSHFDEISETKQFHFCSRLAAWDNDPQALEFLITYKEKYLPQPLTQETLRETLKGLIDNPPAMPTNAAKLRNVYFDKYPWLRGLELALFRIRHWLVIYNVDARPVLFDLVSRRQLIAYKDLLLQDEEGMRFLSTYAVNYIYLLERVVLGHDHADAINVPALARIADGYDTGDVLHLQLLVYYFTHCIIADSNFYEEAILPELLPEYKKMLETLDVVIDTNFKSLSLDTKLEFLVSARICGYRSLVTDKIFEECHASNSPEGTFLIDTHNTFADRDDKKSLDASEHRNVLYIMACQPQIR
jgi:hypothetical protein